MKSTTTYCEYPLLVFKPDKEEPKVTVREFVSRMSYITTTILRGVSGAYFVTQARKHFTECYLTVDRIPTAQAPRELRRKYIAEVLIKNPGLYDRTAYGEIVETILTDSFFRLG